MNSSKTNTGKSIELYMLNFMIYLNCKYDTCLTCLTVLLSLNLRKCFAMARNIFEILDPIEIHNLIQDKVCATSFIYQYKR
jgi:replication initiation and membrane attachment protein DnaB